MGWQGKEGRESPQKTDGVGGEEDGFPVERSGTEDDSSLVPSGYPGRTTDVVPKIPVMVETR